MGTQVQAPTWTFGDRVRKARRSAGLSQAKLAEAVGASSATSVNNWENGTSHPRHMIETAEAIARVTGVPVEWLLLGRQEPAGYRSVRVA